MIVQDLKKMEARILSHISAWKCPVCKTEIRDILVQGPHIKTNERYCKNCGAQVWGKCDCGTHIRYDMKNCPECGEQNAIYLADEKNILNWTTRVRMFP